jgi:hypothetical protein
MTISQRAPVEGVLVDVLCAGRFYDFLESAMGVGVSSAGNRSTRKIGLIPLILQRS